MSTITKAEVQCMWNSSRRYSGMTTRRNAENDGRSVNVCLLRLFDRCYLICTSYITLKKDEEAAVVYFKVLSRPVPTGTVNEAIKTSGYMASEQESTLPGHEPTHHDVPAYEFTSTGFMCYKETRKLLHNIMIRQMFTLYYLLFNKSILKIVQYVSNYVTVHLQGLFLI